MAYILPEKKVKTPWFKEDLTPNAI